MSLATKNAFSALADAKKKAKSSSKSSKDKKKDKKKTASADELEKAIFSQPSINITSWADEDDDDYNVPVLPSNWEEQVGKQHDQARSTLSHASTAIFQCADAFCHGACRLQLEPTVLQQMKITSMSTTVRRCVCWGLNFLLRAGLQTSSSCLVLLAAYTTCTSLQLPLLPLLPDTVHDSTCCLYETSAGPSSCFSLMYPCAVGGRY